MTTGIFLPGPTEAQLSETYGGLTKGSQYGEALASGEAVLPRRLVTGNPVTLSGYCFFSVFRATKTESITRVKAISGSTAAAATPTLCRMGFYSVDEATLLATLAASCANDTTLFASVDTAYTRNLTSTFSKVAGQLYAFATLVVTGVTAPSLAGRSMTPLGAINVELGESPTVCRVHTGQTDLPASASLAAGSATGRIFYGVALP